MENEILNQVKLEKIIDHLNRIFNNLNQYWHSIELLLSHVSKPLLIDDRGLANTLSQLRTTLLQYSEDVKNMDVVQIFGEIKYIGNRLNAIEREIKNIKNSGISQNICIDIYKDRRIMNDKIEGITQDPIPTDDEILKEVFKDLSANEIKTLTHRLGLFGEKKTTFVNIGKMLQLSGERTSNIYSKAIRKLRAPARIEKLEHIKNKDLLKEVFAE